MLNYTINLDTKLHNAIEWNDLKEVKALLEDDSVVAMLARNQHLFQSAISLARADIVKSLIEAGIRISNFSIDVDWVKLLEREDHQFNDRLSRWLKDKPASTLPHSAHAASNTSGSILNDDAIELASTYFSEHSTVKLKKEMITPYSVIKDDNGDLYALFNPMNSNKEFNRLGKGEHGEIRYAQNIKTKEWCAVKISSEIGSLLKEIPFLKSLNRYRGFQSRDNKHYLFMDYIPGINLTLLYDFVFHNEALSDRHEAKLFLNILCALKEQLIKNKIVHQDLHRSNFMITPHTWELTIIDYGSAYFNLQNDADNHIEDIIHILSCFKFNNETLDRIAKRLASNFTEDLYQKLDGTIEEINDFINKTTLPPKNHSQIKPDPILTPLFQSEFNTSKAEPSCSSSTTKRNEHPSEPLYDAPKRQRVNNKFRYILFL